MAATRMGTAAANLSFAAVADPKSMSAIAIYRLLTQRGPFGSALM